jgi:endonuclease/exonuclease/phosphatase family metal-dependent hydrolase
MPEIADSTLVAVETPPEEVVADLARLRSALDEAVPAKGLDRNLLIATWNVRAFRGLFEKWVFTEQDTPKRDLHSLLSIAEIVSRFDVVAIQEARENLKALRRLLKVLGPNWGLSLTDVTEGAPGNGERMAFLFDTRRVVPSGLACEIVVPEEQLDTIGPGALKRQFARTPYAVSFRSGGKTFILITLHVLYGEDEEERVPELRAIAHWLAGWARDIDGWDHNLIALGDFNIDRKGDALHDALVSTGLDIRRISGRCRARSSPTPTSPTSTSSTTRARGSRAGAACPPSRCATRAGASSTSPNPRWPRGR